jgi:squalene synthase HpnC
VNDTLENAYLHCQKIAQQHYENFPTASRLLAAPLRRATAAIYAFARNADDIADEGEMSTTERHARLDEFAANLATIQSGQTVTDPVFIALADTIMRYGLPITPFERLLAAFRSDIDTYRYASFDELSSYCANSANPVGELILRLHGYWNEINSHYSDSICTALQLLNFVQDLDSDYRLRGRIYIPQDELREFGVDERSIAQRQQSKSLSQLMRFQLRRANQLLLAGQPLISRTHGRLHVMLKLTLFSAQRLTHKLNIRTDDFARPTLHLGDISMIVLHSLLFRTVKPAC